MKVLFCTFDGPGYTGGPNSWLRRLVLFLRERGVTVRVLVFVNAEFGETDFSGFPLVADFERVGVDFRRFYWWESTEDRIRWIFRQVTDFGPDLFVPNMVIAAFWAARWVREAGIPTVGVLHSDDEFHHALLEVFVHGDPRWRITDLVCVSRHLETLAAARPTDTRIHRIPYGVPRPETEVAEGPFRMLYVGRLEEEQKRISDVARAMCRAARECDVTGAIAGTGNARADVERILRTEGDGRVELLGLVDNATIQSLMARFQALVLLSDYEGLPIALMEAMATGLVPVCTRMGSGIPELVEDGQTGILVEDREAGFVRAIRRLIEHPDERRRLSRGARERVCDGEYAQDRCQAAWLRLISDLGASAKPISGPLGPPGASWRLKLPASDPRFSREDTRELPLFRRLIGIGRAKLGSAGRKLGVTKR
jgi:glycosyltransferase involved in cell wall biosynthesis